MTDWSITSVLSIVYARARRNIIQLKILIRMYVYYLFGKHGDVFVEGLGRAHVTARDAGIPGRARG